MKIPLIGAFNTSESINVDSQRTVNWYLETQPSGRNEAVLYPTPGSTSFGVIGTGPIRGMVSFNDKLIVISGSQVYSVDNNGSGTLLGTLESSSGNVSLDSSSSQLFMVDGVYGYILDTSDNLFRVDQTASGTTTGTTANKLVNSGGTFTTQVSVGQIVFNTTDSTTATVTAIDSDTELTLDADIMTTGEDYTIGDPDFPIGADQVVFVEGYFVVNDPDKGKGLQIDGSFFWSNLREGRAWDGTDFATAERDSDALVSIRKSNRELWFFGETSTEVWINTGGDPIFTPAGTGYSEWGIAARDSAAKLDQSMIWLSQNNLGQGVVVQATGFTPTIISTRAVEKAFADYSRISDAFAYTMQWRGHNWYVLTFPQAGATWVYDATEQRWFEWNSWEIGRLRYSDHCIHNGNHYTGDYLNGIVYLLSNTAYSENGNTIERLRRSPHISGNSERIFFDKLELEMEFGTGGSTDGQVMVRWSDDYGHTWSQEYRRTVGLIGEYFKRMTWRRMGAARVRVYEIRVTDAVKPVLISGWISFHESDRDI